MHLRRSSLAVLLVMAAGLILSGCAAPAAGGKAAGATAANGFNDPFENTNREIFAFNQGVDRTILVPVAKTYRTVLPKPVRQSVHDFLTNLNSPVVFANDVLQGQMRLAAQTVGRFAVNTTIGVGGMFDVASRIGIPYHNNDLGVTLAVWGFDPGPYIMLPVLGPSNPRDLIGQVGDSFADPGDYVASQHHMLWAAFARATTAGIDTRSRNIESLAEIQRTSLDFYATIRSLYRQRRAAEIRHEESNSPNPGPAQRGGATGNSAMSYSFANRPHRPEKSPK